MLKHTVDKPVNLELLFFQLSFTVKTAKAVQVNQEVLSKILSHDLWFGIMYKSTYSVIPTTDLDSGPPSSDLLSGLLN